MNIFHSLQHQFSWNCTTRVQVVLYYHCLHTQRVVEYVHHYSLYTVLPSAYTLSICPNSLRHQTVVLSFTSTSSERLTDAVRRLKNAYFINPKTFGPHAIPKRHIVRFAIPVGSFIFHGRGLKNVNDHKLSVYGHIMLYIFVNKCKVNLRTVSASLYSISSSR